MKCKTQTESYLRNVALPQATKNRAWVSFEDKRQKDSIYIGRAKGVSDGTPSFA